MNKLSSTKFDYQVQSYWYVYNPLSHMMRTPWTLGVESSWTPWGLHEDSTGTLKDFEGIIITFEQVMQSPWEVHEESMGTCGGLQNTGYFQEELDHLRFSKSSSILLSIHSLSDPVPHADLSNVIRLRNVNGGCLRGSGKYLHFGNSLYMSVGCRQSHTTLPKFAL